MGDLLNSIFGSTINKSADETMAFNAMAGAAGKAQAYLTATLEATTPEVRRLFSEYTTQSVMGHEALTALSLKKGWVHPYDEPTKQLQTSFQQSRSIVTENQ